MGYIAHDAVIVTVPDYVHDRDPAQPLGRYDAPRPDVEGFRASLPDEWKPLLVGPVKHVINGDYTYAFLPDGSKEGWDTSEEGDRYREQFKALFSWTYGEDDGSPYDVVQVTFGRDHGSEVGARIAYSNDRHHQAEQV